MATTNVELYRRSRPPVIAGGDTKYLEQELRKLEAQASSQIEKIQMIEKSVDGAMAEITQERTVRSNETESLAQQILTIQASGARVSTFVSSTAPASAVEGDIWINTAEGNKLYRYKAGVGWQAVDDVRLAQNAAAIVQEQTARTTADSALAQQITSLTATATRQRITRSSTAPSNPQVGDLWINTSDNNKPYYWSGTGWVESSDIRIAQNSAAITSEQTARANADSALATRIDTLEANTDTGLSNLTARIAAEETARSSADSAQASRITTVEATAGKQRVFRQSTQPTASFVGDIWIDTGNGNKIKVWTGTAWVDSDDTRIATALANITAETTARVNGDSALASQITSLTSKVNSNTAAITSEQTARANADSALSSQISSLSTTVNGQSTSIQTIQESVNGIRGRFGVTINNNGHISGISLLSDSSNGSPTSVFRIAADVFAVRTPGASTDSIYWDSAKQKLVVRGDIEATTVVRGAVTNAIYVFSDDIFQLGNPNALTQSITCQLGSLNIAKAGSDVVVSLSSNLVAHAYNTAVASVRFILKFYVGSILVFTKTFLAPASYYNDPAYTPISSSPVGLGKHACWETPICAYLSGLPAGSNSFYYTVQCDYYNSSGVAVAPTGNSDRNYISYDNRGYIQEVKA